MKENVQEALRVCLQTIMLDEPWQDLGFPQRPKYGSLIQKLRPAWKVRLEKILLQQMLSVLTSAYIVAGVVDRDDLGGMVDFYANAPGAYTALGYTSPHEAKDSLQGSISDYVATSTKKWAAKLVSTVDVSSIPVRATAASIAVGCVKFISNIEGMIGLLARQQSAERTH